MGCAVGLLVGAAKREAGFASPLISTFATGFSAAFVVGLVAFALGPSSAFGVPFASSKASFSLRGNDGGCGPERAGGGELSW